MTGQPQDRERGRVRRLRVRERIAQACRSGVALIIAPAGYGKSTSLDDYLTSLDEPSICYRAQRTDRNLSRFILGLAQSAGDAFPPEVAQAMLAAHQGLPDEELPEILASVCAARLRVRGGHVAVDDLHYAQNAQTVRFLAALIEGTSGSIRWVIASRAKANLPLEAWHAKNLCDLPIDENTLEFSAEDLAAAALAEGVNLTADQASAIMSVTRGLPISVVLALRYAKAGHHVDQIAEQARSASYEYLTAQLYAELREEDQLYLCFGALLPALRPDVFEAAGFTNAFTELEGLYRRSSFLTRRFDADGSPEYVCHDLFRDYFLHRLKLLGRNQEQTLRKRAADALMKCGVSTAAVPLYASCGAFEELAQYLTVHGFALIDEGRRDLVRSAVNALPDHDPRWRGIVLGLRADLATLREEHAVVQALFSAAAECATHEDERLQILFRFAQHQHLHDPKSAEKTLEAIIASPWTGDDLRARAFAYLVATRTWNDPYCDVHGQLTEFEARVQFIASDVGRADALLLACCAATYCGDSRAERYGQAALEVAGSRNMVLILQMVYRTLAHNALYSGEEPQVVLDYVEREESLAAQIEDERMRRSSILLRLGLAMRTADIGAVERLLRQYETCKAVSNDGVQSAVLRAHALLHAWRHDFGAAYELLARAVPSVYGTYRPIARALCAVFAAAANRREETGLLVRGGREWLEIARPWNAVLERHTAVARALFGIAAALIGKQRDALRLIREGTPQSAGTALARTLSNFVRALLEGPAMILAQEEPLCDQLSGGGYPDLALIMRAIVQRYRPDENAGVRLTSQETIVLEALESGLTPKQIAEMLDRRLSTIQGHIRAAVSKMGCRGREQAIRIARSRGLLGR